MKKHKIIIAVILFCMIQLVMPAIVFAQSGTIRELTGTVEIRRPGQAGFTAARQGDTISSDTIISTGFRSTALIAVGSSILTVRPLTVLTLTEIQSMAGTETINVSLQAGRVRVDVNPPAGTRANVDIHGPVATASTRGTSFEFDTRTLTVYNGVVAFAGQRGGTMLVSAGSTSHVTESSRAADPIQVAITSLMPAPVAGSDTGLNHIPPIVELMEVTLWLP